MPDQTLMVELGKVTPATVKAQNAKFFTADLATTFQGPDALRVGISCTTGATLQITFDGGTTWMPLYVGGGATLTANVYYEFNVTVDNADKFNIRCVDVAGTTINRCVVVESATG